MPQASAKIVAGAREDMASQCVFVLLAGKANRNHQPIVPRRPRDSNHRGRSVTTDESAVRVMLSALAAAALKNRESPAGFRRSISVGHQVNIRSSVLENTSLQNFRLRSGRSDHTSRHSGEEVFTPRGTSTDSRRDLTHFQSCRDRNDA